MPTAVLCACIGTPSNEGRPSVRLMTPGVAVQGGSDRRRQGNGGGLRKGMDTRSMVSTSRAVMLR